jgi:hypothetical protein
MLGSCRTVNGIAHGETVSWDTKLGSKLDASPRARGFGQLPVEWSPTASATRFPRGNYAI